MSFPFVVIFAHFVVAGAKRLIRARDRAKVEGGWSRGEFMRPPAAVNTLKTVSRCSFGQASRKFSVSSGRFGNSRAKVRFRERCRMRTIGQERTAVVSTNPPFRWLFLSGSCRVLCHNLD